MLTKLQKTDEDTNALIEEVRRYLASVGIRTSRERAWDIFQEVHKLPYKMLIERNPKIKYQGVGRHISRKHGDQILIIKDIGRFEIKGVSMKRNQKKNASIKFNPSADIRNMLANVEVTDEKEEE